MNNVPHIPQFVSVSDLQRNYAALLKSLKKSQNPLLVLKKNNLEAVILTPDFYQSIMEKMQKYEEMEVLAKIKNYTKEKKQGRLKKMASVKELFE